MTQTAPPTISQLQRRIAYLEEVHESQKRTINALQNETRWLESTIFNPGLNELDMRLLVKQTPREIRMGFTQEAPERKVFLPTIAQEVYASPQTTSVHLRKLAGVGVFSYRTEKDEQSGNPRVYITPQPLAETPDKIDLTRAKRGGSTWEDGKRVTRCKDCGSANLAKVSQIVCLDCGTPQTEKTVTPVNDPHSQYDSEPPQCSKSSCTTDTEVGIDGSFEICEPPAFLRDKRIWTVGRVKSRGDGKYDKIPYIADKTNEAYLNKAKSNDPTTWRSWEETKTLFDESQRWARPFDLLMYMCDETSTLIDKDSCYSKASGRFTDESLSLMSRINSYTEFSWSEEAIHIITEGKVPHGHNKNGLEMYSWHRPVAWTGKHIVGTPTEILPREQEVMAVYREYFGEDTLWESDLPSAGTCTLEDAEVIERASAAWDGATFKKLWAGDASDYPKADGTPDHSRADAALIRRIARVTGYDPDVIDRLFRKSGLMRPKWERADYRSRTMKCVFGGEAFA